MHFNCIILSFLYIYVGWTLALIEYNCGLVGIRATNCSPVRCQRLR